MYLVHADCIRGGRSGGQEARKSRLLSYCALQICGRDPDTQQMAPSPVQGSPSPQPQESSGFQWQTLKSACLSHMGMYSLRLVRPGSELESRGTVGKEAGCLPCLPLGPGHWRPLLLGDLEHAEALVLLQELVLGPDLLPEAVQLLLLLLRAQVNARHGADELPHLLELGFEGIQVLVDIWAVLVHAFDDVVNQRQKGVVLLLHARG